MNWIYGTVCLLGLLSLSKAAIHICPEGTIFDMKSLKCKAICDPPCGKNAICVDVNLCICEENYIEIQDKCVPFCEDDCGEHGTCKPPGKCVCDKQYKWQDTIKVCEAHCTEKCEKNAYCSEPDICTCKSGYRNLNGSCQPYCGDECVPPIGRCLKPGGKCQCNLGYEWDRKSEKCVPKCDPRCGMHSYCSAPNHCKCEKGYKPDDMASLSCSVPLQWWIYLIIGLVTLVILCGVAVLIFYYVSNNRDTSYYPNSTFSDNTQIIS